MGSVVQDHANGRRRLPCPWKPGDDGQHPSPQSTRELVDRRDPEPQRVLALAFLARGDLAHDKREQVAGNDGAVVSVDGGLNRIRHGFEALERVLVVEVAALGHFRDRYQRV